MGEPLKLEDPELTFFITSKTIGSRMWFVNNAALVGAILGYLAKYATLYGVKLYSFILMGNHYHLIAKFPRANKSSFMKSLNGMLPKLVSTHVRGFEDGKLWSRRYKDSVLARAEDVEHWFFYCALNPVSSGLLQDPDGYCGYNSFRDASMGRTRTYDVFDLDGYNEAIRAGRKVEKKEFIQHYELKFESLPSVSTGSQASYQEYLEKAREKHRVAIIEEFKGEGYTLPSDSSYLDYIKPGAKPRDTKRSTRYSFYPLVLSLCAEAKRLFLERYFAIRDEYKRASKAFRAGDTSVRFPTGTHRPIALVT